MNGKAAEAAIACSKRRRRVMSCFVVMEPPEELEQDQSLIISQLDGDRLLTHLNPPMLPMWQWGPAMLWLGLEKGVNP